MRLIDADRFVEYMEEKCDPKSQLDPIILAIIIGALKEQPTAYSVDKVVEELETKENEAILKAPNTSDLQNPDYQKWMMKSYGFKEAIEIVKQGGVRNNRKDCEYRHDNGNCLKVGGFCTAVDNKHCEKLKQGGVADDVCEWKQTSTAKYKTECGYKLEEYFDTIPAEMTHEDIRKVLRKLAEYEDLEEQGLLLRLPCKVGDTIYRVNTGAKEPVIKMRVLQVHYKQLHKDRVIIRIDAINDNDMGESCYLLEDFGKIVFLTQAEAEQKLKEMEV